MSDMLVVPVFEITDATLDSSNVAETDNPLWDVGTAYVPEDLVMETDTPDPDIHTNYEALTNNTGNKPSTEAGTFRAPIAGATNWLNKGATNRWKMFDGGNATQTTNADTIEVDITPGVLINTVTLLNINASTVQVIVDDPVAGEVYNETKSLVSESGITDWYAYYFTPIERDINVVFLDLPAYVDATITVIVDNTGGTAAVGVLALGAQERIGIADHGTSTGIIDFSTKKQDTFGNFVVLERAFSNRADYVVTVDTLRTSFIQNLLSGLRATPAIWIGSESLGSTIVYGYFKKFNILLSGPVVSDCSIRVEGLT